MVKLKKQNELVGKIILSNFLEDSAEKFLNFINDIEESLLYRSLIQRGVIMPKSLPDANILRQENAVALAKSGVIAKVGGAANFSIYYTAREFSVEYQISDEKLATCLNNTRSPEAEIKNISGLLNKLRRISTRNLLIHTILRGIVEHQKDYFASNNELNLKPLTRAELGRSVSNSRDDCQTLDFRIDASRISRATRQLSLIIPEGEEIPLRLLFPTRRDMVKRYIKAILNQEKKDIGSCQVRRPYTDEELRHRINEEYGLLVTRREVGYCRKGLGVLSYMERNGYVYHTLAVNFSQVYPFTTLSVFPSIPLYHPIGREQCSCEPRGI
jgi:hypothetical protein